MRYFTWIQQSWPDATWEKHPPSVYSLPYFICFLTWFKRLFKTYICNGDLFAWCLSHPFLLISEQMHTFPLHPSAHGQGRFSVFKKKSNNEIDCTINDFLRSDKALCNGPLVNPFTCTLMMQSCHVRCCRRSSGATGGSVSYPSGAGSFATYGAARIEPLNVGQVTVSTSSKTSW